MNHRYRNGIGDDLQIFKDLKTQFDSLKKELYDIHEELVKIHHGPSDKYSRLRQNELADRKSEILGELRQLLSNDTELCWLLASLEHILEIKAVNKLTRRESTIVSLRLLKKNGEEVTIGTPPEEPTGEKAPAKNLIPPPRTIPNLIEH